MSSYMYHKLSDCDVESDKCYFLDANAWIYIIEGTTDPVQRVYFDFLQKIITFVDNFKRHLENPKTAKLLKDQKPPKVILTPLLISEIVNRIVRDRYEEWKKYPKKTEAEATFKKFRETQEHEDAVKLVRRELLQYEQYFEIIQDSDATIDVKHVLRDWNYKMDFNDQCHYYTCYENRNNNFILVTHDGDFVVEHIVIYTELKSLLNIMKPAPVPKK